MSFPIGAHRIKSIVEAALADEGVDFVEVGDCVHHKGALYAEVSAYVDGDSRDYTLKLELEEVGRE